MQMTTYRTDQHIIIQVRAFRGLFLHLRRISMDAALREDKLNGDAAFACEP